MARRYAPICSVEECEADHHCKGYCRKHFERWRRNGDPGPAGDMPRQRDHACSVSGCGRAAFVRGYCEMHHGRWLRTGDPGEAGRRRAARRAACLVDGCDETSNAKGYCPAHYQRWLRHGDPLHVTSRQGEVVRVGRICQWCGTSFDWATGGHRRFCSAECAEIVRRLVKRIIRTNGLTVELYRAMWIEQGGVCQVCGGIQRDLANGRTALLAVDHDHTCCPGHQACGKCVRGLLCDPCNGGLGMFGDDPVRLRAAAQYLEDHRATVNS